MKRFMFFSIAVLCLSISALIGFQLGSRSAVAQPATSPVAIAVHGDQLFALNSTGDVWVRTMDGDTYPNKFQGSPRRLGSALN